MRAVVNIARRVVLLRCDEDCKDLHLVSSLGLPSYVVALHILVQDKDKKKRKRESKGEKESTHPVRLFRANTRYIPVQCPNAQMPARNCSDVSNYKPAGWIHSDSTKNISMERSS